MVIYSLWTWWYLVGMLLMPFSHRFSLFESKSELDRPPLLITLPVCFHTRLTHSVLSQNDSDCRSLHSYNESNQSYQILTNEVTVVIVQFAFWPRVGWLPGTLTIIFHVLKRILAVRQVSSFLKVLVYCRLLPQQTVYNLLTRRRFVYTVWWNPERWVKKGIWGS